MEKNDRQGNIVAIHQDAETGEELYKELFTIKAGSYGPYTSDQAVVDSGYTFTEHLATSDPVSGKISKGETKTIIFTYTKLDDDPILDTVTDPVPDTNAKIGVEGVVTWDSNSRAIPNLFNVVLLRDEVIVQFAPVCTSGDGKFAYTNLDKYDSNGNEYAYAVGQVYAPNFEIEVGGFTIKNTYK